MTTANTIRAAMVIQPEFFAATRLTAQQLEAVRTVRDLGRPVTATTVSHVMALNMPHACVLLKACHRKGFLKRFKTPCRSGGIEYAYEYDLPEPKE